MKLTSKTMLGRMRTLDYRRNRPDHRQPRLTRAEFIIILAGAAVLTAILAAAAYFYFHSLNFPDW